MNFLNPLHEASRMPEPWWLQHAWDDTTMRWFKNFPPSLHERVEQWLNSYVKRYRPLALPGILPTAEWLTELYLWHDQADPEAAIDEALRVRTRGDGARPLAPFSEWERHPEASLPVRYYLYLASNCGLNEFSTRAIPLAFVEKMNPLLATMKFTPADAKALGMDNVSHGREFVIGHTSLTASLFRNPNFAALPASSEFLPSQAEMAMTEAIKEWEVVQKNGWNPTIPLVQHLICNPSLPAPLVAEATQLVHADRKKDSALALILQKIAGVHPNQADPFLDVADPVGFGFQQATEAVTYPTLDLWTHPEYSNGKYVAKGVLQVERVAEQGHQDIDVRALPAMTRMLLHEPEEAVRPVIQGHLGSLDFQAVSGRNGRSKVRTIGMFVKHKAMMVGATMNLFAEEAGFDAEGIPMEWFTEILG